MDSAVDCVHFECGDYDQVKSAHNYWEAISDFMKKFKQEPDDVVKDLVNLYPKESLRLMDMLVTYTNLPAVLR